MRSRNSWRRLRAGTVDRSVLVVDFELTGRPEAGFRHFAEASDIDQEIWQATQPPESADDLLPAEQYLDFWAGLPEEAPANVDAILGYCAGCSFLPELARRIEQSQDRPPTLLLFDPEPITVASLHQDFRKTVDAMPILPAQEKYRLLTAADEIRGGADHSFATTAIDIVSLYEDAVDTAFTRLRLDESLRTEFVEVFRSYVSYLAAASDLSPEAGWRSGIALTSRHSSPGAEHASREITFPVSPADLLRDPRVSDAVFDLLDEIPG